MSEKPQEAYHGDDDMSTESDSEEDDCDSTIEGIDGTRCVKLNLDENIAAYKEKRELLRESETVPYSSNFLENVTLNYIIVKQIIGNLPWQERMLCKHVCNTWHSAVQALRKEQMSPEDFVINLHMSDEPTFIQSGIFYNEPLVVMTFANTMGINLSIKCDNITPSPCKEPCEKEHSLLDLVNHKTSAPKNRMHAIRANYISYFPLPQSITYKHTILHHKYKPFIGGLYIPTIPGVEFHVIHLKSNTTSIKEQIFDEVGRIGSSRIFKGILLYVTETFLLHTVEDIVFLNFFKDVQPDIPYALGGCIIDETVFDENDINHVIEGINDGTDFTSDNLLSIGLFTVPKVSDNREQNFDMFSLILESSDWSKTKIQQCINEFSKKVPKFEHSVAVKLSCVGRDQKHKLEQDLFRDAFPNTRIVGCYGNGELGLNHPASLVGDSVPNTAKRHRRDPGPQYGCGIMYSYSTVFVYIGWGKILHNPIRPSSSQ